MVSVDGRKHFILKTGPFVGNDHEEESVCAARLSTRGYARRREDKVILLRLACPASLASECYFDIQIPCPLFLYFFLTAAHATL